MKWYLLVCNSTNNWKITCHTIKFQLYLNHKTAFVPGWVVCQMFVSKGCIKVKPFIVCGFCDHKNVLQPLALIICYKCLLWNTYYILVIFIAKETSSSFIVSVILHRSAEQPTPVFVLFHSLLCAISCHSHLLSKLYLSIMHVVYF